MNYSNLSLSCLKQHRQHWISCQDSHDGQVEAALDEVEVAEKERDVEEHHDVTADHLGEIDADRRAALIAEAPGGAEEEVVPVGLQFVHQSNWTIRELPLRVIKVESTVL